MSNNKETTNLIVFALCVIIVYLVCIFLTYNKMLIDSIMYLKYLH